jgi:predicted AlkP superfamily pyrophosphatase or phosphodiesterase
VLKLPVRNLKNLILFIDALGYSSITRRNTPNLFDLFQKGTFRPVKTLLGYSNAIIPSIFSGAYPSQHNIWSIYKLSLTTSPFKVPRLFPSFIFDKNLLLRYAVNTMIYNRCKDHGLLPPYTMPANIPLRILKYFDISMKKHIIEPNALESTATLFDNMRQNHVRFEYVGFPWNKGSQQILASTEKHILNPSLAAVIAYIDEIDHYGHKYGLYSNDFVKQLRRFDELCASFLRKIVDADKDIVITIFSDHGMKDVDGTINLKKVVDLTGLRIEEDYLVFLDSTIARFWTFNKNARKCLTEALTNTKGGRLLRTEETIKYKINFNSNAYGDLQYLADTGKLILPNFYTIRGASVKAMHGWDPDDKTQDSFLFTNRKLTNATTEDVTKIFYILLRNLRLQ